jgi:hypothetical protein
MVLAHALRNTPSGLSGADTARDLLVLRKRKSIIGALARQRRSTSMTLHYALDRMPTPTEPASDMPR